MSACGTTVRRRFAGGITRIGLTLACLAVLTAGCPVRRQSGQSGAATDEPLGVEHTVAEAQAALDSGDAASAERLAREALNARPDSTAAQEALGLALRRQNRLEEAAEPLWQVVRARMAGEETSMAAVEALDAAGRYGDAVTAARSAVSESPDSPDANLALGLLLLGTEHFNEACEALLAAAELEPSSPGILLSAAEAALGAGDYDRAAAIVDDAMAAMGEADDKSGDAARGMLLLARTHTERAANPPPPPAALPPPDDDSDTDDQVSDSPSRSVPVQDDKALAESYIAEFRRLAGSEAGSRAAIGEMLVKARRPEQALAYLTGLPNDAPAEAHTAYAQALLTLGRGFDTALTEAEAGAADSDDAYAQAILGWAQWKNGDGESAAATLSAAVSRIRAPSARARAYYQLGRALEGLDRAGESSEALAQAKKLGYH